MYSTDWRLNFSLRNYDNPKETNTYKGKKERQKEMNVRAKNHFETHNLSLNLPSNLDYKLPGLND